MPLRLSATEWAANELDAVDLASIVLWLFPTPRAVSKSGSMLCALPSALRVGVLLLLPRLLLQPAKGLIAAATAVTPSVSTTTCAC